jgi:tetratricopeptide (TPR) repeat protein
MRVYPAQRHSELCNGRRQIFGGKMTEQDSQRSIPDVTDDNTLMELEQMVQTNPDNAIALYNLGLAYAHRGKWEDSIKSFRAALKLRPGFFEARLNVSGILLQIEDYDGCIEESLKVLQYEPNLIQGCINIGVAYTQKGMPVQAIDSFNKALRIDPNSAYAHLNIGNVYLSIDEIDKSVDHFTKAVEIDPTFGMAHNNLATAAFQKGDVERAKKHAREALSLGYEVHPDFLEKLDLA